VTQNLVMTPEEVRRLGAAITAEEARRSGSRSFAAFIKQGWQYVPQVEPLVWNWHMDALALHGEEVARGNINWLAVNIPPGFAKSVTWTVLWPAWIWSWWPKCQFIFGSYSHDFVVRDARRCRDVVMSDWYQETYCKPGGWNLRQDYGSADNFSNTAGGVRFATSTGGQGAGLRGHVIAVDDPLNIGDAYSKAAREEATRFVSQTLSQRWVAGYPARFVLVMQRLHEEDPTAWLLKQRNAQHLRLPSEFEPHRRCKTYHFVTNGERHLEPFWEDPRQEAGELLFPSLFSRERIEDDKLTLGNFGYAGQHQQDPVPEGGGMFQVANWRYWRADEATMDRLGYVGGTRPRGAYEGPAKPIDLEDLEDLLLSIDATFRETNTGSYVAIHCWGKLGARRLLLDRVHKRMDFHDTVAELLAMIRRWPEARRKLVEGKANGDAIISTLERAHGVTGLEAVSPGTASKVQRAMGGQPYQAAGNVELPDGAPWLGEYIAEHAAFPNGSHDDDVDAQSQGLLGFEQIRSTLDYWGDADL